MSIAIVGSLAQDTLTAPLQILTLGGVFGSHLGFDLSVSEIRGRLVALSRSGTYGLLYVCLICFVC